MLRVRLYWAAAVCSLLTSCVQLGAESNVYWYQPHYLTSVDEASNRLQFLSPHFAPMEPLGTSGNYFVTTGYSVARIDVNKLGINVSFTKSGFVQGTKYYWGWWGGLYDMPTSTPYKDDIVTSVIYADIRFFRIVDYSNLKKYPAPWCVVPVSRGAPRNDFLCVTSKADAQGLIDAIATLVQGSGGALTTGYGMTVELIPDKELQRHPEQGGLLVKNVDLEGPPAQAGIKANDIIHAINGQPSPARSDLDAAVNGADSGRLIDRTAHVEILRQGKTLAFDLLYPGPNASLGPLQKTLAEAAKNTPAPTGGTAAAPSSGFRLGIQVRAVTAADAATLNLPEAKGIFIINVEKSGMADLMRMLSGDVILEVNGSEINDVPFFIQFVRSGAARSFRVWRNGKVIELAVPQSL